MAGGGICLMVWSASCWLGGCQRPGRSYNTPMSGREPGQFGTVVAAREVSVRARIRGRCLGGRRGRRRRIAVRRARG